MPPFTDKPYWLNRQLFEPYAPPQDHTGIEAYSVVRLDTPGIVVPENIYISTEKNPAQASIDMYWALQNKPCNFATWVVPEEVFTTELRQRVAQQKQKDSHFFNAAIRAWQFNPAVTLWADGDDRKQQECAATLKNPRFSITDIVLAMDWLRASVKTLKDFTSSIERRNGLHPSRHFNAHLDGRADGLRHINLHLDGVGPPPSHKIDKAISAYPIIQPRFPSVCDDLDYCYNPDDPGISPFRILSYRFLWSQNDIGTLCADQEDIDETRTEYLPYSPGDTLIRFKNPLPVLYAAAPWSISMVSSYYHPHHPAVHSSPVKPAPGKHLERILWDNSLYVCDNLPVEEYKEWVEEKAAPMPLFSRKNQWAP